MANKKKKPAVKKDLGGMVVKTEKTEKKITKKQKTIIIVLSAAVAALLIAGIVILSLALTVGLGKKSEDGVLRMRDVGNGFKKFYVEGGTYPGLYAVMTIQSGEVERDVEILLLPEYAPITVNNFIQYVNEGFYDGTVFHRIVDGSTAFQGGGYTYEANDEGVYSYKAKTGMHDAIKGEFKNGTGDYAYNIISHFAGTISMARANDKNSATSGFFFIWDKCTSYDGDYAAFGFIVDPDDVAFIKSEALAAKATATTSSDGSYINPNPAITVTKVEIVDLRKGN